MRSRFCLWSEGLSFLSPMFGTVGCTPYTFANFRFSKNRDSMTTEINDELLASLLESGVKNSMRWLEFTQRFIYPCLVGSIKNFFRRVGWILGTQKSVMKAVLHIDLHQNEMMCDLNSIHLKYVTFLIVMELEWSAIKIKLMLFWNSLNWKSWEFANRGRSWKKPIPLSV